MLWPIVAVGCGRLHFDPQQTTGDATRASDGGGDGQRATPAVVGIYTKSSENSSKVVVSNVAFAANHLLIVGVAVDSTTSHVVSVEDDGTPSNVYVSANVRALNSTGDSFLRGPAMTRMRSRSK